MSAFDVTWLALREAADHKARADALTRMLRRALQARETVSVIDLGSGTGSNLRHMAPQIAGHQHWRLIDSDPALLAAAPGEIAGWAAARGYAVEQHANDLTVEGGSFTAHVVLQEMNLASHPLPTRTADVVTGNALLDLVSRDWLVRLIGACSQCNALVLFALSYDGRIAWEPPDALDASIRDLVNRHQQGDKGFGPALGPEAATTTTTLLRTAGYEVETAASDWRLDSRDAELQQHLHAGWASAASEMAPTRTPEIQGWLERRADLLAAGTGQVTVSHMDVLGFPPG